ncbi:DNA repair protein RecO [Patescibacteria group bacterium]|nr:DNA repair protein RecO [Patescibacteria group bacterium]
MAIRYRTQGFILKKTDRGESDRIFTIYTRDFGKLEILAKAIRKIKSKLRKGTEIFYLSEIEFVQGKIYKTLIDAVLVENFRKIGKDLRKMALSFRILEILDNLIRKEEKDEKTWNLLINTFKELNRQPSIASNQQLLFYYFIWNFLSVLGYKPELNICSLCNKKLVPKNLYFNFKEGGVTCEGCFRKAGEGERISPETIKVLRFILEKKWRVVSRLRIEEESFISLKRISDYWIKFLPQAAIF